MAENGKDGGNLVLYAALVANLGIAVAKFIAAGITGSSAMLTEGFHSVVDSTNQLLLLYGKKRSRRPPDEIHPLGYGRELYFWSFVVAIMIFAVGAGFSIYEGVLHIIEPEPMTDATVNYVVLGIAFVMEGTSWVLAIREFAQTRGQQGWWEAIRRSKDPPTFIVLFEDSAALAGLVIAAIGVWLAHFTGNPLWDGAASILIGLILGVVAVLLARESKDLLIGERASPRLIRAIHDVVDAHPEVVGVLEVATIHLAPDSVFVAMSVDFEDAVSAGHVEALIADVESQLRRDWPEIARVYIKPQSRAVHDAGIRAADEAAAKALRDSG
ncbi:cation diffusion facilitator family transporter [Sphingomonas quercus]|uniref:Cation diffusion facilitator family transporter n=1 Tax=Sphingomonas quercus TaxID=2842451 RepID=A0ABS6BMF7_9SPHN|nr:cation diffusion facilitator family transporter [Sphingomonas quercus]MBU3078429.1 cation diffusion facilitator family transporter [Sphingomonas quercus]